LSNRSSKSDSTIHLHSDGYQSDLTIADGKGVEMVKNDLLGHLSSSDCAELMMLSHRSLKCQTKDHLKNLVLDLKGLIEFENAVCAQGKVPDAFLDPDARVNCLDVSLPDGYIDLYFQKKFQLTDAVLCEFLNHLSPVNWASMERKYGYDYPASMLAIDFNLRDGWTHGIIDTGTMDCTVFYLGGPQADPGIRSQALLTYIIPFYAEAFKRAFGTAGRPIRRLTHREREVLKWIKAGKSSWEISVILKCSKRVVDFHVNNLKHKLNVVSRAQAVAVGLKNGIIEF